MADVAARTDLILNHRVKSEELVGLVPHEGLQIRTLIADDDPTNARLLKHALEGIWTI